MARSSAGSRAGENPSDENGMEMKVKELGKETAGRNAPVGLALRWAAPTTRKFKPGLFQDENAAGQGHPVGLQLTEYRPEIHA